MTQRCVYCIWFDTSVSLHDQENTGACRVRPPVADDRSGRARWPFVSIDDWCAYFDAPAPRKKGPP